MDKVREYISNMVRMGYTEFDAQIHFLQDENIKQKYKNIYIDNIPNYTPPVPMDIDVELGEPPKNNPVLRR